MTIVALLNKVNDLILNPIITLAFAVAMLVFFWGVVQFINSETADAKRAEGQRKLIFGLIGMFVMVSAFGIIHFILSTFGIAPPSYPGF